MLKYNVLKNLKPLPKIVKLPLLESLEKVKDKYMALYFLSFKHLNHIKSAN